MLGTSGQARFMSDSRIAICHDAYSVFAKGKLRLSISRTNTFSRRHLVET